MARTKFKDLLPSEERIFTAVWFGNKKERREDFTLESPCDYFEWQLSAAKEIEKLIAMEVNTAIPFRGDRCDPSTTGYIFRKR